MTTLNDDPNQIDLNLPGLGPDTIFAGAGADSVRTSTLGGSLIFGQGDNDTIVSVGPNDTIYGGADEDSIRSQRTPALLFGDSGNDTIIAEARSTLVGGPGDDLLQGTVEANVMFGNEGSDTILGGSARRDTIYGGKGNDAIGFFKSGGGNNLNNLNFNLSVSGVGGNEGSNFLRGDLGDDLVVGINQRDTLFGGRGNDTLTGVGNSTYLSGDDGNDRLSVINPTQTNFLGSTVTVGIEKVTLLGGLGNDTLTGGYGESGRGKSFFDGGDGNDSITVFATQDTALGGAGDDFIQSSITSPSSPNPLINNPLTNPFGSANNVYVGGQNSLDGGAGNDTIVARYLSDTMIGGEGTDSLSGIFTLASGGDGNDTINANGTFGGTNPTSITLEGGLGNDSLIGNVNGGTVTNLMNGGEGNDTIVFGTTGDQLIGDSAGNDFISYASSVNFAGRTTTNTINDDQGNNLIFGGNGTDVITTGSGNDTLYGGPATLPSGAIQTLDGDDTLISNAGNDVLVGGFGNDQLIGGDGDDSLVGGPGADTLIGGSGSDTIFYSNFREGAGSTFLNGTNPDQISEFVSGQDKFVLKRDGGFPGLNPASSTTNRLGNAWFLPIDTGNYVDAADTFTPQALIVYEGATGRLLYDPNTAVAGDAVYLALISNKPSLSTSDIFLI